MAFMDRVRYIVKNITVEPLIAFYIIPSLLGSLATTNMNLEKACLVNLQFSEEICRSLKNREKGFKSEETQVQQLIATMYIWRSFIQSTIPILLIMFLGSLSDRLKKRKPFMLIPMFGEFITNIYEVICVYFFYEIPVQAVVLGEALFPALTGGWMTMNMAMFSYLGDITTVEERTLRVGIVNVFSYLGVPVGIALSGITLKKFGYFGVFFISAIMFLIGFIYGVFAIKEVKSDETTPNAEKQERTERKGNFIKECFDIRHIKDTWKTVLRVRSDNTRKRILLLMIVLVVVSGPSHGESTVKYMFMQYRFGWGPVQYSMYATYSVVIHLIGTAISVGLLSHVFKVDDAIIGIISCVSRLFSALVYAFAEEEWQIFMAPLVDIVDGTASIAMRSIGTKLVPADELGRLNSLLGAFESLTPLMYGPMYAYIYAQTMEVMPGAFFLVGAVLTTPAIFIFGWLYLQHRKDKLQDQQADRTNINCSHKFADSEVTSLDQREEVNKRGKTCSGNINLVYLKDEK